MTFKSKLADYLGKAAEKHKSLREHVTFWLMMGILASFSGQASAANKLSQMICSFKNQFFDSALIGAVFIFAGIAVALYKMMDDDSKVKGQLIGLFAMLALIAALPEIAGYLGYAAC